MGRRVLATKALTAALIVLVLVSGRVYPEDSGWLLAMDVAGVVLLVLAATGRIWAAAHIAGFKRKTIVQDGPYSLVRHPLYLSSALGFVGAGLVLHSILLTLAFVGIFWISHWPVMLREERRMEHVFPEQFAQYKSRVPRFFPRLRRPIFKEERVFRPAEFSRALFECALIPLVVPAVLTIFWAHENALLPTLVRLP